MDLDPIVRARAFAEMAAELLNRAIATSHAGCPQRSEVRYAEALARTLLDELDHVLGSETARTPCASTQI